MRAKREEPISATGHSVVPSALAEVGEFKFSSEAVAILQWVVEGLLIKVLRTAEDLSLIHI